MRTDDSTDQAQIETAKITFPGKAHLTDAVVDGTLRYYIGKYGVFVLFLLAEANGFSVCYARGIEGREPNGDSFERLMTLGTLDEAHIALTKMQELASAALKPTATETNT